MFFGIAFLIIGIGWLLQNMGYIPGEPDIFWPVIFIAFGLSILFGRKSSSKWCCWDWHEHHKNKDKK